MVVFAVVAAMGVMVAAPAGAKEPLRGDQTMVLNQDMTTGDFGLYGCSDLSWFGSVVIDGETYGMALYPLPGRLTGNGNVLHYTEGWKVWTGEFTLSFDPVTEWFYLNDCTPGEYVLSGIDSGVGIETNAKFVSNGSVDEAASPFEEWLGRHVHQDGLIGPVNFDILNGALGFEGDLRLN
jgi:hypothetical protein